MSQLDYLWSNFGSYQISNKIDKNIPTGEAVKDYIQRNTVDKSDIETEQNRVNALVKSLNNSIKQVQQSLQNTSNKVDSNSQEILQNKSEIGSLKASTISIEGTISKQWEMLATHSTQISSNSKAIQDESNRAKAKEKALNDLINLALQNPNSKEILKQIEALKGTSSDTKDSVSIKGAKLHSDYQDLQYRLETDEDTLNLIYNGVVLSSVSLNTLIANNILQEVQVVTNPDGQPDGTYLQMTFNTSSGPSYIYVSLSSLEIDLEDYAKKDEVPTKGDVRAKLDKSVYEKDKQTFALKSELPSEQAKNVETLMSGMEFLNTRVSTVENLVIYSDKSKWADL